MFEDQNNNSQYSVSGVETVTGKSKGKKAAVVGGIAAVALAGGCAPPQGAHSPRTLAHSAHSAAAPAAAGRPWGFHHTPAADAKLGREGGSERGDTEGGGACLLWFRDLPGGPVAEIPWAQGRGPGFDHWSGN